MSHNRMWRWTAPVLVVAGAGIFLVRSVPAAESGGTVGAGPAPTFTKDVAPILQRACQNCHRAGSIAPMSLFTYKEARPWARSIKQKVAERDMPP